MSQNLVRGDAEIDQARDLVDVNLAHLADDAESVLDGSEKPARRVVALERMIEQSVHLFG